MLRKVIWNKSTTKHIQKNNTPFFVGKDAVSPPVIKEPVTLGDPARCQILPGREMRIEIQKGKSGLGLSIVGGADTLLVRYVKMVY